MSLDFRCNIQMVGCNGVGGTFLAPSVPTEHHLNATLYLSIVPDHIHAFLTTVYSGLPHITMSSQYSNGLHSQQTSI